MLNPFYAKLQMDAAVCKFNIYRRFLNPTTNQFELAPMYDDDEDEDDDV